MQPEINHASVQHEECSRPGQWSEMEVMGIHNQKCRSKWPVIGIQSQHTAHVTGLENCSAHEDPRQTDAGTSWFDAMPSVPKRLQSEEQSPTGNPRIFVRSLLISFSVELMGDLSLATSHVQRMRVDRNKIPIVRQSMPYGTVVCKTFVDAKIFI